MTQLKKQVIFKRLDHAMTGMKEQIQQLIAGGQTKDALNLLVQVNPDALLLQAQYNNGEKQFNLGLIEFSEWGRIQARVNFAALEMAGNSATSSGSSSSSSGATTSGQPGSSSGHTVADKPRVFISYNHHDTFAMRAVKAYLEDHDIKVIVDIQDMGVGNKIETFIDKALQENQFILSIISQNSLKSGWVNQELGATLLLNKFGKKWLPVLLDKKCFEPSFYNETMDEFDVKIKNLQKEIKAALSKNRGINAFTDELSRHKDLQNDFDKTIQALKSHLAEDIGGNLFEHGMSRVVKAIKGI